MIGVTLTQNLRSAWVGVDAVVVTGTHRESYLVHFTCLRALSVAPSRAPVATAPHTSFTTNQHQHTAMYLQWLHHRQPYPQAVLS